MIQTRPEQQIFEELESLCSTPGYIHVLAYFSWRDNYVTYSSAMTADDMMKSYAPSRLIRTELSTLIGLMIKSPIQFSLPSPASFQGLVDRTEALLNELHHALNAPMMSIFKPDQLAKAENPFSRADILREPIFYGGESAYSFQYRDFARQRYAGDDEWLLGQKGYTIADAHAVMSTIARLQDGKMAATMRAMRKSHPKSWTWLPGFSFAASEVAAESDLPLTTVENVLTSFTAPEAPANGDFRTLGDFNVANATPVIRGSSADEFISLQSYALGEALYDSPYYWMMADKKYRGAASKHRGQFTEEVTAARLESVFGRKNVFRNIDVVGSKGQRISEVDILVTFGDRMLVVQCKSKKLTLEARKGNDLQLQFDFKGAVQDAYDQGLRCAEAIVEGHAVLQNAEGVRITPAKPAHVYILSVVSDHYPALTVQGKQFLQFVTTDIIHPPLVTDVFFIDTLTEMLPTPLRLLSYIDRRVNYTERVSSINEYTILGYHLKKNLWLDDSMQFVMIAEDFSVDLDVAMTVRREGIKGQDTPRGVLTRLQNTTAGKLVRAIEMAPDPALIDLGFLLLTLSEDALRDFGNGIDHITKQTRSDGLKHDLTLGFQEGKTGITVHCSREPNDIAGEALLGHCRLRKYAQKADSWFGLSVREADGLPKFGVHLTAAWEPERAMDKLTAGMNRVGGVARSGRQMKAAKIGRNEPCPCGSGRKHKKCCRA